MTVRATAANLRAAARRHGLGKSARLVAIAAARRAVVLERVLFFEMVRRPRPSGAGDTRWATPADLNAMSKDPVWGLSDLGLHGAERLLDRGHLCVLNVVGGQPAGYAWLNPRRLVVPKLRAAVHLQDGWVHIYKGFTHPGFRGRRLGNDRFLHWRQHFADSDTRFLSDFSFDNLSTLARIERSGLRHVATGTYVEFGTHSRLWIDDPLGSMPREAVPENLAHRDH